MPGRYRDRKEKEETPAVGFTARVSIRCSVPVLIAVPPVLVVLLMR